MDSPKQCDLCGSAHLTDLGHGSQRGGTVICHGCGGKWWKVWRTRKEWEEWINEDAKKGVDTPPADVVPSGASVGEGRRREPKE